MNVCGAEGASFNETFNSVEKLSSNQVTTDTPIHQYTNTPIQPTTKPNVGNNATATATDHSPELAAWLNPLFDGSGNPLWNGQLHTSSKLELCQG